MSPWEEQYARKFYDALDKLPEEDVVMLAEMFEAIPSRYDDRSKSSTIGKLFHEFLRLRAEAEYAAKVRAALDVLKLGR